MRPIVAARGGLLWWSLLLAGAAVLLRAVDIVLLRRFLDRPVVLGSWLLTLLALLLATRLVARRVPAQQRGPLQKRFAALDAPALALLSFFLVLLFVFPWGFARAASDGREYFVQTRSLVMDFDLDFANENAVFGTRGTTWMYAFGMPLLWVPFFLFAHAWLWVLNLLGADWARDGYFNAYQKAVGLGSLFYGCAGLVLLFRLACDYFSRCLAAISVVLVTTGSFLLWYLVVDNSMSHATSMFAVALFVTVWHRTRDRRTFGEWALLGATAGLMCMVRWQNLFWVVLPAADAAAELLHRPLDGVRWLRQKAAFGAAFVVAFSPQMYFWRRLLGGWLAAPSQAHDVDVTALPVMDVLFSPDRGLFSWTPILLFAFLGGLLFTRKDAWLGSLMLAAFAGQVWINGTVYQGGHGFGGRKFANCAVLFVLGMATFLDWHKKRPYLGVGLLLGWLTLVNLGFINGLRRGELPMTGHIPWARVVRQTTIATGNPFMLPASLSFAWRYGTDLEHYERIGPQLFRNFRLAIGTVADERFLAGGWHDREQADEPFRWSDGTGSSLLVPLMSADGYTVRLRAMPLGLPDGRPQSLTVLANGVKVATFEMRSGVGTYEAPVGDGVLRKGVNRIDLRYAWAASPADLGIGDDARRLAVAFREISLLGSR